MREIAVRNLDIQWDVYKLSPMRLVLDTNVIVAAFRSRNGASNLLLRLVDRGAVTPLCSTALFLEYEAVLSREETRKVTGHSLEDVAAVMSALAAVSEGVDISFRTRPMLSDVADEMVLEAALNGQAEAIVTHIRGDRELIPEEACLPGSSGGRAARCL